MRLFPSIVPLILFTILTPVPVKALEPKELSELKIVFDKYNIDGSILIYDLQENTYYGYGIERCNTPYSPASSFKIPNSLIALETGVVTPETIFPWNGKKMRLAQWEQDVDLEGAFRVSSVPVYQEIARQIGVERMQYYLRLFNYGEIDVNENNIDKFWLEGSSAITIFQQIYFLQKLYSGHLPISENTMKFVRKIMQYEKTDTYSLSGKTGWAVRQNKDVTWFVGWIEKNEKKWIFATNLESDTNTHLENLGQIRIDLTKDILKKLGVID